MYEKGSVESNTYRSSAVADLECQGVTMTSFHLIFFVRNQIQQTERVIEMKLFATNKYYNSLDVFRIIKLIAAASSRAASSTIFSGPTNFTWHKASKEKSRIVIMAGILCRFESSLKRSRWMGSNFRRRIFQTKLVRRRHFIHSMFGFFGSDSMVLTRIHHHKQTKRKPQQWMNGYHWWTVDNQPHEIHSIFGTIEIKRLQRSKEESHGIATTFRRKKNIRLHWRFTHDILYLARRGLEGRERGREWEHEVTVPRRTCQIESASVHHRFESTKLK